MTVEEMKAVAIRTVCPEELVDITKLSIDKSLEGGRPEGRIYPAGKKSLLLQGRKYHCKIKLFR